MNLFERWRTLPRNKTKEELDAHYQQMDLEKGDLLAMIIAGFITFVPLLLAIAAILLLVLKLFGAI